MTEGYRRPKFVDDQGSGYQHSDIQKLNGVEADVPAVLPVTRRANFSGGAVGNAFSQAAAGAVATWSAAITIEGAQNIVIRSEFEKSNGAIRVRPFFADGNTSPQWYATDYLDLAPQGAKSDTEVPSRASAGWWHGVRAIVPTYGAKQVKLYIMSMSNPKVSIWVVGA